MRAVLEPRRYSSPVILVAALGSPCAVLQIKLEHLLEDDRHWFFFFDNQPLQSLLERARNADVVLLLRLVAQRRHLRLPQADAAFLTLGRIAKMILVALPP